MSSRPYYDRALAALEEAHKACFRHEERSVLGMSHGPFSGVNVALGIVADMQEIIITQQQTIQELRDKLSAREGN